MATVEPTGTEVPPLGVWRATRPGSSSQVSWVREATAKPTECSSDVAAAAVDPTTSGTLAKVSLRHVEPFDHWMVPGAPSLAPYEASSGKVTTIVSLLITTQLALGRCCEDMFTAKMSFTSEITGRAEPPSV